MKKIKPYIISFLTFLIASCSTGYEVVMPYKNLGYSGERLFPVRTNDSEFTFRIWIGNSTSLDRIISISKDLDGNYQGQFVEVGKLVSGKTYKDYFREIKIAPKDGFELFKEKLDSLNLFVLNNQTNFGIAFDQPFSYYVVEIKEKQLYNMFKFETYYPNKIQQKDKYAEIEKLIFDQFDIRKYFKFKLNGS
jgi:hypothetical protein